MSSLQLNDTKIIKAVYDYLKLFKEKKLKRSSIYAHYMLKNSFYKEKTNYQHQVGLKKILDKCRNKKYSNSDKYVKRLLYKDSKEIISGLFYFMKEENYQVYLVKSTTFTKTDTKISDLWDKIEDKEDILLECFEVIKVINKEDLKNRLMKMNFDLKINNTKKSGGFNVYNFVMVDENGNKHVSVPFALVCFRQFSKRDKKSVLGKFGKIYEDEDNEDEVLYYTNILFDYINEKYKENFAFPINFYNINNNNNYNNDYPTPGHSFDIDLSIPSSSSMANINIDSNQGIPSPISDLSSPLAQSFPIEQLPSNDSFNIDLNSMLPNIFNDLNPLLSSPVNTTVDNLNPLLSSPVNTTVDNLNSLLSSPVDNSNINQEQILPPLRIPSSIYFSSNYGQMPQFQDCGLTSLQNQYEYLIPYNNNTIPCTISQDLFQSLPLVDITNNINPSIPQSTEPNFQPQNSLLVLNAMQMELSNQNNIMNINTRNGNNVSN
ncbi:hypothetical protein BCR36DRAFT_584055 [Piromyces finnis]|uniref:Uncharacterized protein n=1 Tax=Piromyces finnis TaxID=1754191 RepID=A0A1Y1V7E9_9FUNG|nr:hypothetical protein BCR36DRAFT_584055 [Piromyces finnis]|eukprot:ORX48938.1 hypothetical protein BCR36DRAFT_584055 [Piromyces finnis]